MSEYDWNDLLRRLGPRQLDRLLSKAGGRAASVVDRSASKLVKARGPVVSGQLRAALKSLRKRERGRLRWRIQWRADVPYWGRVINVNSDRPSRQLIAAYEAGQDAARERWRRESDVAIARVMKEALR